MNQYKGKRNPLKQCEEYIFFNENRGILDSFYGGNPFSLLEENWFNTIRSNILIRGLLNKLALERIIKENSEKLKDKSLKLLSLEDVQKLPSFSINNEMIFMPFFSKSINLIYIKEPYKIFEFPYSELENDVTSCEVDPFDSYGFELFDSPFTKLELIDKNNKEAAFYYAENDVVYFINSQGRLDEKLFLFDKFIKHPKRTNMIERLKPVVDAYFNYNQKEMIAIMQKNGFISGKFVSIFKKRGTYR